LKSKKDIFKYSGVLLTALLIIGAYFTFDGKNVDKENFSCQQESDVFCFFTEDKPLFEKLFCCFSFSGIAIDLNDSRYATFCPKKCMDDSDSLAKLQSENGKLFQHASFLHLEDSSFTLYQKDIYLYLKKLLI